MIKKVIFRLESDIVSCGINTESNFFDSRDYIPGGVLRAGFAKDIYLSCGIDKRNNFIELKDPEGRCVSCENRLICEKFSDMTFSFLYNRNCIPAPFSTKVCKLRPGKHPIKDIMLDNGRAVCASCKEGFHHIEGRMADANGYIDMSDNTLISIKKNTTTHTAVNYAAGTARYNSIYTTRAISKGLYFEGLIDDCDTGLIKEGTVVYVGKYSSSGFGKLVVEKISEPDKRHDICKSIQEFTSRCRADKPYRKNPDKMYAPILFTSDAKLGFESGIAVSCTSEYRNLWTEKIFGDGSIFEIENVYAQNKISGGYDTSAQWGKWRKDPQIITVKGTSVLVSFDKNNLKKAVEIFEDMLLNGIGSDTKNGYGRVDICNKIHLIGAGDNEENN